MSLSAYFDELAIKKVLPGWSLLKNCWVNFAYKAQRNFRGRRHLGQFLLGMYRWPFRTPIPLSSISWLVISPILVAFSAANLPIFKWLLTRLFAPPKSRKCATSFLYLFWKCNLVIVNPVEKKRPHPHDPAAHPKGLSSRRTPRRPPIRDYVHFFFILISKIYFVVLINLFSNTLE